MITRRPSSTLFPYTTLFRSRSGPPGSSLNWPLAATAMQPATRVPRTGGRSLPNLGIAVRARNAATIGAATARSEEHTSELQSQFHLVCRLLLEKKNHTKNDL